jgi:endonuclease V-like protein UPF0215 family
MSTTFGVLKAGFNILDINDVDELDGKTIDVAFRSGKAGGGVDIRWINELAPLLPDDTIVFALDNTSQGVFNIGDLKKLEAESKSDPNDLPNTVGGGYGGG